MKQISFGKISVPLEDYAIQGNAVLGIRESGKSYTSTYAGECLMDAGIPITAIDPIGIWHSLRIPAKGKGYPVVVVGGQHGDLPLTPASAESTMRAAMAAGVSVVFDMFDVKLSKRDWRDIVVAVVKVLLYENKEHGLRHVFIEEAPEFVPQRIAPDQGVVYSFVERLVRMGGNSSLGATLIGQRAEEMNKAVLELCDCLVLHRQKGRRSLENLSKWLEVASPDTAREVSAAVPKLKNGEAFVWPRGEEGPVRTNVPEKNTFHPDRRARHKAVAAEAKRMDVGDFVTKMKNELGKLPAAGARQKTDIAENYPTIPKEQLAAEYRRGLGEGETAGYARGWRDALNGMHSAVIEAKRAANMAVGQANIAAGALDTLERTLQAHDRVPPTFGASVVSHPLVKAGQKLMNHVARKAADAAGIPPGELAVLRAAGMYPVEGVERDQLSILTGYKKSSRDSYVARLLGKGYLSTGPRGALIVSPAGMEALGSNYEPLPTGQALRDYWLARLPEGERKIFEVVVDVYPKDANRGELSAQTGYKKSSRDTYLSRLKARRLIDVVGDGAVKASAVLFQ